MSLFLAGSLTLIAGTILLAAVEDDPARSGVRVIRVLAYAAITFGSVLILLPMLGVLMWWLLV